MELPALGSRVEVVVEIPKGSRVKRRPDGSIEYVSPLGVPFDYGSVPDLVSGDGDPLDAIILGGPRSVGTRLSVQVHGVVPFVDAGRNDPKLVCADRPPAPAEWRLVSRFLWWFVRLKRLVNAVRGAEGATSVGRIVSTARRT